MPSFPECQICSLGDSQVHNIPLKPWELAKTCFYWEDRYILTPKTEFLHQERAHSLPTQAQMARDPLLGIGSWPREPFFIYLAPDLGRDLAFQWSFLGPGVALVLKKVHSWVSALFRDALQLWTLPPHSLIQGHQFF